MRVADITKEILDDKRKELNECGIGKQYKGKLRCNDRPRLDIRKTQSRYIKKLATLKGQTVEETTHDILVTRLPHPLYRDYLAELKKEITKTVDEKIKSKK